MPAEQECVSKKPHNTLGLVRSVHLLHRNVPHETAINLELAENSRLVRFACDLAGKFGKLTRLLYLLENVCPILHHRNAGSQKPGMIIGGFHFVLLKVRKLHLDIFGGVSQLI